MMPADGTATALCAVPDGVDLRTDGSPDHPLTRALRELVQAHNLHGAVLLTFAEGRVGINSSAPNSTFCAVMVKLADIILARFANGDYDAALGLDLSDLKAEP